MATHQRDNQARLPVTELQIASLWVSLICKLLKEIWHLQETGDLTGIVSKDELRCC